MKFLFGPFKFCTTTSSQYHLTLFLNLVDVIINPMLPKNVRCKIAGTVEVDSRHLKIPTPQAHMQPIRYKQKTFITQTLLQKFENERTINRALANFLFGDITSSYPRLFQPNVYLGGLADQGAWDKRCRGGADGGRDAVELHCPPKVRLVVGR